MRAQLQHVAKGIVLTLLAPSPLPRLHKLASVLVLLALVDPPTKQGPPPLVALLEYHLQQVVSQLKPGTPWLSASVAVPATCCPGC